MPATQNPVATQTQPIFARLFAVILLTTGGKTLQIHTQLRIALVQMGTARLRAHSETLEHVCLPEEEPSWQVGSKTDICQWSTYRVGSFEMASLGSYVVSKLAEEYSEQTGADVVIATINSRVI